jgi:hypothetical protein
MTIQRPDPNRPLFADMDDDDDETKPNSDRERPAPIGADPMGVNPAAGGAIPLGAPDSEDRDAARNDEADPRGR